MLTVCRAYSFFIFLPAVYLAPLPSRSLLSASSLLAEGGYESLDMCITVNIKLAFETSEPYDASGDPETRLYVQGLV